MNEIRLSRSAIKFLKKLKDKKLKDLIKVNLENLREDYTIGSLKTGDLKGIYSLDVFYNKTNYEIAYTVIDENIVIVNIIMIGSRENFYKQLKKYLRWEQKT